LELLNVTKRYPSIVACSEVNLVVKPGEIHAVLGENGAGKSTLMKIIYGSVKAESGTIFLDGHEVSIHNPAQARRLGIGMVFQHFSLFETLSVVENIALVLDEPFNLPALAIRVKAVSERYGLPLDPNRMVHSLSVGERQRVEIVRCLLQTPKLLILDEPTSVLTPQAVQKLFETLRQLASEGVARNPVPLRRRDDPAQWQGHRQCQSQPGNSGQPRAHDDRPRIAGLSGAPLYGRAAHDADRRKTQPDF
jgi:simple sugar transport system ATP-binding protein